MSLFRTSIYKTCMTVVIVLLLLILFCLSNVERGSGPYYLCLFSLIVDVPFMGFLLYKLIQDYREVRRAEKERKQQNLPEKHS